MNKYNRKSKSGDHIFELLQIDAADEAFFLLWTTPVHRGIQHDHVTMYRIMIIVDITQAITTQLESIREEEFSLQLLNNISAQV